MPWKPAAGGDDHLTRTGSKSIRGQISSPIPIPSLVDEELPFRDQAATIGEGDNNISRDADLILQDGAGNSQIQQLPRIRTASSGNTGRSSRTQDFNSSSSGLAQRSGIRNSSTPQPHQFTRGAGQGPSRGSISDMPHRKKSTLRSALSRLFGRKKRNETKEKPPMTDEKMHNNRGFLPHKPHRSDTTWERRNQLSIQPSRSLSMPITEYDRALRSHSVGPEDVKAIISARNSLNAESRLSEKNFPVLEPPRQMESSRWAGGSRLAGLSPRPASSHDRVTRVAGISDDPSEIGRAISSDLRGLKRRSRSLSVMPNFELAPHSAVRRRSAEIRYWRESYVVPLMSPTSTTSDEETRRLSGDAEESVPSRDHQSTTSEQTIQMGLAETTGPTPTPTPTGPGEPGERPNLVTRVSSLETRMSRLEGIVLQLGQSIPALSQPPNTQTRLSGGPRQVHHQSLNETMEPADMRQSHVIATEDLRQSTSRPSTRHSDASKMTFGEINDSTPRATILSTDGEGPLSFLAIPRDSDVSARGRHGSVTFEHYINLMSLFETERSAREALEAQVRSLGRQIQIMGKTMAYHNRNESDSPSLDRSLGEVSVFDHDDEDDYEGHRLTCMKFGYSTLGMEDSGIATESRSDDEYPESFATPVETYQDSFEVYEHNESETDPMLSNGRKLSLSHLTMRQPLTLATMQHVATNVV